MAERFGGKYSPAPHGTETAPRRPPQPSRAERRTGWLFAAALPFAIKAFFTDPAGLARNLTAFGLLVAAAWLTREGVRAAAAYNARNTARRPAFPRTIAGSVLTGAGLFLGAWGGTARNAADRAACRREEEGSGTTWARLFLGAWWGMDLVSPVLLAVVGLVLHHLAFGADPVRDKGMEGVDVFQQDRVGRFVTEAESYLTQMHTAAERTGDRMIVARVERFGVTARALFRTVEEDPRDLTAARRYLGVYLMGARDATIKFADLWMTARDPGVRSDYEALLADLEDNFARRTTALLADNRSDLDIEIEVLRDRLKREGVRLPTDPSPVESEDAQH